MPTSRSHPYTGELAHRGTPAYLEAILLDIESTVRGLEDEIAQLRGEVSALRSGETEPAPLEPDRGSGPGSRG